ncbi:DNA-binding IscR family transcriptional regulator [Sporomusaceae bacterium BoRhaA]|uniref:Rrf2 family transcriptional regulator n=1 Tax=Pelorhabdus rhamnosifermentans TaxID=2772457 RepID=UPI0028A8C10F|nr:Rrf2 family transcriptional regulator [Pelorhabdus rhamnosifermentans]MBU2699156.1 DNA-binding IscR family transcriptional regulator [Pelorhabdus rhamnosifermentans]
MNNLHQEILWLLMNYETSYAKPMNSDNIGRLLHVTPAYVRSQLSQLVKSKLVGVRRGNGGGYYMIRERGLS